MSVRLLPLTSLQQDLPSAATGRIAILDIEELVAAGEAIPLLPEFNVGPTWYGDMWWVIPEGEWDLGFIAASEPDQIELSTIYLTLRRATPLDERPVDADLPEGPEPDSLTDADWMALRKADSLTDASVSNRAGRLLRRWTRR